MIRIEYKYKDIVDGLGGASVIGFIILVYYY